MRVRPFEAADAQRWDAFCDAACNATFLHTRRFLSYHGERFADRSLVVEDERGAWLGLLPAALSRDDPALVVSHPGITYGGLVHAGALRGEAMLHALQASRAHFAAAGFTRLQYKAVPHSYQRAPAQDDLYALFRLGARRIRGELSSCIDLAQASPLALPVSERRRRALKKAQRAGLSIDAGAHLAEPLWQVIEDNLARRHGARPVHTLAEITELARRFPDRIRFVAARRGDAVLAGAVLFDTGGVVHAQYIAAGEEGMAVSALDLVFDHEITRARASGARWFDFGTSNEDQGRVLNEGLHRFKSEFGAGGVAHEFYELDCAAEGGRDLAALHAENALLREALEQLPHGMSAFDDRDRLVIANARYREIWGLPEQAVRRGSTFAEIMRVTPGAETEHSRSQPRPEAGSVGTRKREWQLDDGRFIEIAVSRRADGSCVALHEDVSAQREAQSRIAFLARHDLLTGLPNRAVLREELDRALPRCARGEQLALLCLDLDRFKPVNDTYGHAAGDLLLKQVATRLRGTARETDLIVRLGGDEFAVVQVGVPQPSSATALARRLIDALGRPFQLDGHAAHIGTSVGIAVAPGDGDGAESLLRNADLALYRSKSDGRGMLHFFEPEMDARMQARRGLEADLRLAIERGEFHLVYQPQVDALSGAWLGMEALLRWDHPKRGAVAPLNIIPLAEETGLIVPIGRWVLEQACADAAAWPNDVRIAVNVSAVQFRHGALERDVLHALQCSGLPARRLELEITESALLRDTQQVQSTLHELRGRGVRTALDDFGTGYSSLSTLRGFPFDRLKIDRSFVRDASSDAGTRAVIGAVVALGAGLGMQTTVEGVETAEQMQVVRALGCAEVQGWLTGRPMRAGDVAGWIGAAGTRSLPAC